MSDRAPELLTALADTVATMLAAEGIEPDRAADIGIKVMDRMRDDWGGEPIYFPKGCAIDISRRDMEMFDKFNGRNHTDLSKEYNLSVIHVYRIVKYVRAEMIKKRQGDLFQEVEP